MKKEAKALSVAISKLAQLEPSRSINELKILIGMERVIARLEFDAELAQHILFKGGFVLLKSYQSPRFTRDVDALAEGVSKSQLKKLIQRALEFDLQDGLWYGDFSFKDLELQDGYGGLRISFAFQIGEPPATLLKVKKLSRLHIDLSFEEPPPYSNSENMNSIIQGVKPVAWRVYPLEYIIAEKLEAMFSRGSTNSRAKDIFDLNLLFPHLKSKSDLKSAIQKTFSKRPTRVPQSFEKVATEFSLSILKAAWPGVEIEDEDESFENHWLRLLEHFRTWLS